VFLFVSLNQNRQQLEVLFFGRRQVARRSRLWSDDRPFIPVDQFCEVSSEDVGRVLAVPGADTAGR
jgi:hypothetical protein